MHFLGCNFTQNALAAGALPRTPLGKVKCSPDPLPISGGRFTAGERERRGKREERKGKRVIGEGKGGKRGGREGGRRRETEGRGVCVIGVRGDRRPCNTRWCFYRASA